LAKKILIGLLAFFWPNIKSAGLKKFVWPFGSFLAFFPEIGSYEGKYYYSIFFSNTIGKFL